MDPAILDLLLAMAHHLLAFGLVGAFAMEMAAIRPGITAQDLPRLRRIDAAFGIMAHLVILVGVGRIFFGLKGWEYYVHNWMFWGKMAAFTLMGLCSLRPTRLMRAWRRAAADGGLVTVPLDEIRTLRRWLMREATALLLVPLFAAAMARGFG